MEERRREDELDRVDQALEPTGHVRLVARDHLGAVDAREGPAQRVLERARGAAGERHACVVGHRAEVAEPLRGEGGALEGQGDDLVRGPFLEDRPQAVAVEERVEDGRGHDAEGGHVEREARDLEVGPPLVQDPGGGDEPPGLAAERARPDPADPARRVEEPALEAGDVLARRVHTQPRSRQAWATRLMAITYAASRVKSFLFLASSETAWKAAVILVSSRARTSSFSQ